MHACAGGRPVAVAAAPAAVAKGLGASRQEAPSVAPPPSLPCPTPLTERLCELVHGVLLEAGRGGGQGGDAVRELHLDGPRPRDEAAVLAQHLQLGGRGWAEAAGRGARGAAHLGRVHRVVDGALHVVEQAHGGAPEHDRGHGAVLAVLPEHRHELRGHLLQQRQGRGAAGGWLAGGHAHTPHVRTCTDTTSAKPISSGMGAPRRTSAVALTALHKRRNSNLDMTCERGPRVSRCADSEPTGRRPQAYLDDEHAELFNVVHGDLGDGAAGDDDLGSCRGRRGSRCAGDPPPRGVRAARAHPRRRWP